MKNIKVYLSAGMLCLTTLFFSACQKDPFEGVVSHERAITSFELDEGQIGVAEITRTPEEGKIVVYVAPGTDLSNRKANINTSYQSSVSPASGETVDLSDSSFVFEVTSASGRSRAWELEIREFEFDLGGEWQVNSLEFWYWIGEGEDWGWDETRPLNWNIADAAKDEDNTLEFILEGVTENGSIYGTYTFAPGPDGEYANFIYNDGTDYNYKFRKLPPRESGTWIRDFASNTVIFNQGEEDEARTLPLSWSDEKNTLQFSFNPGPYDIDWDGDGNKQQLGAAKEFWYMLQKVE